MSIRFQEHETRTGLKGKRILSAFLYLKAISYRTGLKHVQLNYIFCTDEFLLQMNQKYLNHDTLTDILTFDLGVPNDTHTMAGEIYISYERVRENAVKYGVPVREELLRVIFHGMLHLCGFKDKKKEDSRMMRMKEDECIAEFKKYTTAHGTRNIIGG